MNLGIDAIGLAFPTYSLELAALARARDVDPAKYLEGLGMHRMSIPAPYEDTVTLAARAGADALELAGIDASEIGMCVVGTETAVDHSKPVSSYVQGLLGLPRDCRIFETKHACYGGTAALLGALDWVRAGSARGRKALVLCADIARYGLHTAGEPTQGAGAVALLVGERPRLLDFTESVGGSYSNDVADFWRPLYSKDAVVDGRYSVTCYLEALEGAYRAMAAQLAHGDGRPSDNFAGLAYHVPYPKMAVKAHRHLRALEGDNDPAASFDRLVGPGLVLPRIVGNIYTGSLYLALASLLAESPHELDGRSVGLFSYGSGSCAEFFTARVVTGASALARSRRWRERVEGQRRLDVPAYEALLTARGAQDEQPATTEADGPGPRFLGVRDHRRVYSSM